MDIGDFCKNLGSTNPTPGGGAAAGYALSFGAACAEKAARFSIHGTIERYIEIFSGIREVGLGLAADDQRYFQEWQDSRKLPKVTEEQRVERAAAIDRAVKMCALTPYAMCREAIRLVDTVEEFLPLCNSMLVSDAAVGVSMAAASFESSVFNIIINLPYLKDLTVKDELESFINNSVESFETRKDMILTRCTEIIKGGS